MSLWTDSFVENDIEGRRRRKSDRKVVERKKIRRRKYDRKEKHAVTQDVLCLYDTSAGGLFIPRN